ncbi:MAG TPA: glycosyltransferase family 4 protein [Steroidobacteraceae bacterium]|nr:glycosyltransferase family 4 protein [Steroidobacteraceae bacterium]
MRVVYLSTLYPPDVRGGTELILQGQAQAMAERGHEVTVLTIGPQSAPAHTEEQRGGVRVVRAGFRNRYFHQLGATPPVLERLRWHWRDRHDALMAADARSLLRRLRPEVVCCHNLAGWSIAAWQAVRSLGLPLVQVLHDQYLLCPTAMMFRAGRPCARQCLPCRLLRLRHARASLQVDAVVGVSRFVLQKLLRAGFFAGAAGREVLYNSTAASLPPACAPRRAGRPASALSPLRFGFIGTLAPCKGIEPLLRSVADCGQREIELLVAGRGEPGYEGRLRQRFAGARIRFLGYVPPAEFFRAIDVCVVPSLWDDTLPSVVFEALGFGVPVIGARRGGIPEMIRDGYNGLLFEPDAPGALVASMRSFVEQPGLLAALAVNCRVSAAPFHDLPRWLERHEAILSAAIDTARARERGQGGAPAPGARAGALPCEG